MNGWYWRRPPAPLGRRWVGSKTDATAPSVPSGLAATPVSATQIDLSWTASTDNAPSGVKEYVIRRDGVIVATVAHPSLAWSDTGLTADTEYSYTILATDWAGNSSAESSAELATTLSVSATRRAMYRIMVGWEGRNAGAFQIGISELGGPDGIGWAFTEDFGSTIYDDVTSQDADHRTHEIVIRRGRSGDLGVVNAGECDLELADADGRFNTKTLGPLAGMVKSMRPVKVEMSLDDGDTWLPRFYGWSDQHRSDPRKSVLRSTIHASDIIEAVFPTVSPVIEATGPITMGAALGLVLDACGWEDPARRDLPDGDMLPDFSADGTKSARAIIEELLVVDPQGILYQAADGTVVYEQRWVRYDPTVDFSLDDTMIAIAPGQTLRDVINIQTVTVAEGEPRTAEDGDSQADYGPRRGSDIQTVYLNNDDEGEALAAHIVGMRADGIDAIYGLPIANRDPDLLEVIANVELTDRVLVGESLHGATGEYLIEALEDVISDGGAVHRQTWKASVAPDTDPFLVGVSDLGGTDIIVY